ncbi:FHA domain-containing protein [Promicromonospora sp. NPDC050880]|uniref:FHA domain-containing protein n=1 Tax=Promicromonospora sp. NPDC050880 TaxID=3364406 RepID=UPI00379A112A
MTVTCPEGHVSQATDYCDVCGTPIPAAGTASSGTPAASPAPAAPEGEPVTCPNCGEVSPAGSLFCENCGYDFTTGTTAPPPPPVSGLDLGGSSASAPGGAAGAGSAGAGSAEAGSAGAPGPGHDGPRGAGAAGAPSGGTPAGTAAGAPDTQAGRPGATPPAGTAAPSGSPGGLTAPPVPGDTAWVAEIWVDPDWYAHERPEDPLPSAGLPGLVTLRQRSLLVGRPSQSRNIRPDVDCGSDPGVSRRHCQLTTDGQRWWVEDLGSSNGTFVAAAGEPLPDTPLTQGVRQEIEEGDRVYIGAWTRLVIRKALPGEV